MGNGRDGFKPKKIGKVMMTIPEPPAAPAFGDKL
jgi:hypothetical protein